jgi:hypothetical protein
MTNVARLNHRRLPRCGLIAVLLAAWWSSRPAAANVGLSFHGGPERNLNIDLIFWGNFTDTERADVRDYATKFSQYINGALSPPGMDPAIRYYGIWGALPGNWINSALGIGCFAPGGGCTLTPADLRIPLLRAEAGNDGASFDFNGSADPSGLPSGDFRIAVVVSKGTVPYSVQGISACGYHGVESPPWAAVMFDCNVDFETTFSHEVLESLSDTITGGWLASNGAEGADQCFTLTGSPDSPSWTASSGDDISGISGFILNPAYGGINSNITANTCQIWEPQQYTPMSATFEPAGQTVFLVLAYLQPNGHVSDVFWTPGQPVSGPFDLGQPAPNVTAVGKPSIVYSPTAGGQFVFAKGSDSALWYRHGGMWTSLGGLLWGDPHAVVWNNGDYMNVFVLGTDSHIYNYAFHGGNPISWFTIDNNTDRVFMGPPRVISRSPDRLDLFAVGGNGHLEWIPYSISTGWSVLTDLGTMRGNPHHTPVGFTSWGTNRIDIFATSENAVGHRFWAGSWESDYDVRSNDLTTAPSGSPAVAAWAPNRLDAFVVDRSNGLNHSWFDGANFHADGGNPIRRDAVGDPVVMSRGVNQLDIIYRTTSGSLTHLNWNNGWTVEDNFLPAGSVQ